MDDIQWIREALKEIKEEQHDQGKRMDIFFEAACPGKHEQVQKDFSGLDHRITVVETRVYVIVTIAMILTQVVIQYLIR